MQMLAGEGHLYLEDVGDVGSIEAAAKPAAGDVAGRAHRTRQRFVARNKTSDQAIRLATHR